jgi:hypothetical protein
MWIEAILSQEDLSSLVAQLLPLNIRLGEDEGADPQLHLSDLASVELIENQGLRIRCRAAIRWAILGIDVPIKLESLALLLSPSVVKTSGRDALAFKLELDQLDVAWIPAAFDETIKQKINRELKEKQRQLTWNFSQNLSHVFKLPSAVRPIDALELDVAWGKVRVTGEALVLAVSFHGHVHREGEVANTSTALVPVRPYRGSPLATRNGHASSVRIPTGLALAGGAALASMAAYGMSRATTDLWRYWRRRTRAWGVLG